MTPLITTQTLFDFSDNRAYTAFYNVDDGVMGGVSQGNLRRGDGTLVFSGTVRLENNGGFSSMSSRFESVDLSGFDGMWLRVRGDGKRYRIHLKDRATLGPVVYQATFMTRADEWIDAYIAFASLRPQWYGQSIPALPINTRHISAFTVIIEDKQKGTFALEIARIGAYKGDALQQFV